MLRDFVIVIGVLVYQQLVGRITGQPAVISKINTACQLVFVVSVIASAAWQLPDRFIVTILGGLVVYTSITSGMHYVLVWSRKAREHAVVGPS